MQVEWLAFVHVFVSAMLTAVTVVGSYALGLRLLVTADTGLRSRTPLGDGAADHTEAEARQMLQSPPRDPPAEPTVEVKRWAQIGAYACFVICAVAVLLGIFLLVSGV